MLRSNRQSSRVKPRFGSEIDVEALTGISRRTLQTDRLLGRQRFPWYKIGRRVLYDLDEIEAVIRRAARGVTCLLDSTTAANVVGPTKSIAATEFKNLARPRR